VSRHAIGIAIIAMFVVFAVLAGSEPRHVAFYDACLLVSFPLAVFLRRRR
jgi:hypothetical protein